MILWDLGKQIYQPMKKKLVLINFIKTNFANQAIPEIKLAFELAVAGGYSRCKDLRIFRVNTLPEL